MDWLPTQWASYQTRKICGCACAENAGNVFPATAGKRSRYASRHVRAAMYAGIANWQFPLKSAAGENVPGIPGACATHNFTYLVRGPCSIVPVNIECCQAWCGGRNTLVDWSADMHSPLYFLPEENALKFDIVGCILTHVNAIYASNWKKKQNQKKTTKQQQQ